jgi:succinate dehydrogenase / fumarate reductase cytochrome b subunit
MDIGAGYELPGNRFWARMTILGSVLLTALLWAWILYGRGA